jgi:hypothetical protein
MKHIIKTVLLFIFLPSVVFGASVTRYVDGTLAGNCVGGSGTSYRTTQRDCGGTDGTIAYTTIQTAITAMSAGDTIYLRGGTHQPASNGTGCVLIPVSKNGSSWTPGYYNTISSYPGEWAVIDGQNNCGTRGVVLGNYSADFTTSNDIKYWLIERLEIKNGKAGSADFSYGFFGNGGPFKLRYLYVHDNKADSGNNNPFGVGGYHWQNSVVEYCYFLNNGAINSAGHNPVHIGYFSDYNWNSIANNGFNPSGQSGCGYASCIPGYKNIIRYNLFENGNTAFRHKGTQNLTGRTARSPFSDTYSDYGDNVHHNIVKNTSESCFQSDADFVQIHHNICDNTSGGIMLNYSNEYGQTYKNIVYNNTLINSTKGGIQSFAAPITEYTNEVMDHYGYVFNNIIDNAASYGGYCNYRALTFCENSSSSFSLTNYFSNKNYVYRPPTTQIYNIAHGYTDGFYTQAGFEAQSSTGSPHNIYYKTYDIDNLLYAGTSGANKYITVGTHTVESGVTVANGGVGGAHPYLDGVTFPSYLGAVNPSDAGWVAGVLGLASTTVLQAGTSSDPSWIEGGSGSPSIPATVQGLTIRGGNVNQ